MENQVVLSLSQVSVIRGDRTILGPIDFQIQNGERWVILGPNGAGKSTLLNILATRMFPTSGTVTVLNQQMGKVDLSELRTRIGICAALISEDIPGDEIVRDVVLTAAYAILGRWN
jgi:iron complex transport system ATP-binding protein